MITNNVIKSILKAEKTKFIWLSSSQMLAKTNKEPLCVSGVDILLLDAVRDLSVVLDSYLVIQHVNGIVYSCFYQVRQLRSVR